MSILKLVESNEIISVEMTISRYKELKEQQKKIEAEMEFIKKGLITEYLTQSDTLTGNHGIILATYKEQIRISFEATKFKNENAALYDKYCEPKSVKVFLVK